ncbi:GIY-YIG nuclease family protein [Proteinivorax hydrogeniformans]|uniref:GIY-YIG nuclease family protein n=1 Tax=Proteinivorax hydrogeniformans TaxID=1826727 RepID=A0AAU8HX94_9FIRM
MLRCSDNTLYTGWTTDLKKRLKVHNSGKGAKYTAPRLPVKLVYFEQHTNQSEAQKREWEIKQLSKAAKEKLILIKKCST